jgi:hypothetical protein
LYLKIHFLPCIEQCVSITKTISADDEIITVDSVSDAEHINTFREQNTEVGSVKEVHAVTTAL